MRSNKHDVLPAERIEAPRPPKAYIHVLVNPEVLRRLKHTATSRGYSMGEFLEQLLDNVLPKD